jgi:hypothetical protein
MHEKEHIRPGRSHVQTVELARTSRLTGVIGVRTDVSAGANNEEAIGEVIYIPARQGSGK